MWKSSGNIRLLSPHLASLLSSPHPFFSHAESSRARVQQRFLEGLPIWQVAGGQSAESCFNDPLNDSLPWRQYYCPADYQRGAQHRSCRGICGSNAEAVSQLRGGGAFADRTHMRSVFVQQGCWCDDDCWQNRDCCQDYFWECQPPPSGYTQIAVGKVCGLATGLHFDRIWADNIWLDNTRPAWTPSTCAAECNAKGSDCQANIKHMPHALCDHSHTPHAPTWVLCWRIGRSGFYLAFWTKLCRCTLCAILLM